MGGNTLYDNVLELLLEKRYNENHYSSKTRMRRSADCCGDHSTKTADRQQSPVIRNLLSVAYKDYGFIKMYSLYRAFFACLSQTRKTA